LRHLNLSKLSVVNRIVLDKHFETNVGKRRALHTFALSVMTAI